MNRNLFSAWYALGLFVLALLGYWIAVPFVGMSQAKWCFSILGFLVFLPVFWALFFRRETDDERDRSFWHRAFSAGTSNGFFTAVVVAGTLWGKFRFEGIRTVPIDFLGIPVFCGFMVALLSFSVLLLLFYYKGEDADKENRI